MRLEEVKLKNFRGYKNFSNLKVHDLTALIGKNDAGKSTILEALEIFFNNKVVVCEKDDLSIDSSEDYIEISCVFSDFPENLTIDTSSETSLKDEFLLNQEGFLEIKKVFKCTSQKPKPVTFVICEHPINENYNDLLLLKKADLKKRAKLLNIPSECYSANNNASMRKAIYGNCMNLKLSLQEINVDKEDSKKVYAEIEKYLPMFALFQSDRSSLDSDKEVSDPMDIAVSQAIKGLEEEIDRIKKEVQAKTLETANRTLEKLKEMNSELANSLIPRFRTEPNFNKLFSVSIDSDEGISINKRGSGVRRLILLNFFRAEAERRLKEDGEKENIIYAFEEPETSQHPSHQKMLIQSFIKLSRSDNCQVLLTTHTPALGELLPLESLRLIDKKDGRPLILQGSPEVYIKIAETLGVYSENIPSKTKAIVLVEGRDDLIFLRHLAEVYKDVEVVNSTFEDKDIAILPTGGCKNLKLWVTMRVVQQFNVPWAIFMDSDKESENDETYNMKVVSQYKSEGAIAITTKKREIENYLHPSLFTEEYVISDYNDVKKEIEKRIISKRWTDMTFSLIQQRECYQDATDKQCFELQEIIKQLLDIV
ncbi:AAA family ATPase [Enterococcus faecalis]|uniref:AAA family ATPase n=2 Tax=Enterococcus TaxID=1350 RepID=UPI000CF2E71A|nr:AAA family ATPase [Enterococcus faecalis]EGO7886781.1 AAA family ATPase [Enterococcus faecalis]PQB79503.1 lantibiotic ABC transporter [Enterococcus faecalis]